MTSINGRNAAAMAAPTDTSEDVDELAALRLRADAALSVVPPISTMVADRSDRGVVVAYVMACWLALPETVRSDYRETGRSDGGGLEHFGWDYVEEIERSALPDQDLGFGVPADVAERMLCERWQCHIQQVITRKGTD